MTEKADDFIRRMRAELAALEATLEPGDYADLVAYFGGFFSEEDRRCCGGDGEDEHDGDD